jgi:hypothetical protein
MGMEFVDWVQLARDKVMWRKGWGVRVNTVMNLRVLYNAGIFKIS